MKRKLLKTCTLIAGMSLLFTSLSLTKPSVKAEAATMRSAKEIVQDIGVGWNLGNTLDSKITTLSSNASPAEFETGWGNPVTTKAMIDKIKTAGFKTIRIPVTWGEHMDSNNKVNAAWMNRVQEVVDYCINDCLYVILNVHHDGNWCIPTYDKVSTVTPKLQSLWEQIATHFKNYNDHLIFETLNEPRLEGTQYEWNGGTSESRDVVNNYNETALNAIRSTGGNNASRAVMMPTYAASGSQTTMNDFKVPNDKNIIASIHAYSPYYFAMDISSSVNTWGSSADKSALDSELDSYLNTFKAKGVPVVIGEFGSINKSNTSSRAALAEYYVEAAQKRGIPCIWWDNNYAETNKGETFGLFNRSSLSWYFSSIKDALIKGYKNVHPDSSSNITTNDTTPGNTVTLKDGWYYIKNVNAQKYLQVASNVGKSGQNVELGSGTGVLGQRWYLTNSGNGYITLKSGLGEFMLDVTGGRNTDGANIEIYKTNSQDAQKFMIKSTSTTGAYTIATKSSNLTKVLDDYNFLKDDGTNVCQWTYGGKSNQQWIFESINSSSPNTSSTTANSLTLSSKINNWGSAYQLDLTLKNCTSKDINGWTLQIKKDNLKFTNYWDVDITEDNGYYVLTPKSWKNTIPASSSITVSIQGSGSISTNFSYELTAK